MPKLNLCKIENAEVAQDEDLENLLTYFNYIDKYWC